MHSEKQTSYIVLPSWRWSDWSMFSHLQHELLEKRINPIRRPDAETYQEIINDEIYQKELDGFYHLLFTFLSLHKNSQYDFDEIRKRLQSNDIYTHKRNSLFLLIYRRIFVAYEKYLFKTRQYDFADMINSAQTCVEEIPECAVGYKYILLDEVQDLSRNRFMLIRAILLKNNSCKLFAVGDDWQSIYRFTGSDLALIRNFEESFNLTTRRSFIESTHRFGEPTIRTSCNFIQRNPTQSRKKVHNIKQTKTPIYVILNKPGHLQKGQDAESLQIILERLMVEQGYDAIRAKTIQVISRYNHDITRIDAEPFCYNAKNDSADIYNIE